MNTLEKQIATILEAELNQPATTREEIETAAKKIAALLEPHEDMLTAAAKLEANTTRTLMEMLAATILATLIEEQGGGRANIRYSPASMDHMMKNYTFTAEKEGMVTNVRIKLREDSHLFKTHEAAETWTKGIPEDPTGAKPQAEPKEHTRPKWAIRSQGQLWEMKDMEDARTCLDSYLKYDPTAHVENRHCMHLACPSTGCTELTSGN